MNASWWWIDRWRKSSAYTHLTLAEQGAYRNLLDECWLRERPLPNDERILANLCGDAIAWPKVREKVLSHFVLDSDGWHNTTVEKVILESKRLARKQARYRLRVSGVLPKSNGLVRADNGRFTPAPPPNGAGQAPVTLPGNVTSNVTSNDGGNAAGNASGSPSPAEFRIRRACAIPRTPDPTAEGSMEPEPADPEKNPTAEEPETGPAGGVY